MIRKNLVIHNFFYNLLKSNQLNKTDPIQLFLGFQWKKNTLIVSRIYLESCFIHIFNNHTCSDVYLIQHYVIKFVSDLQQVGGFFLGPSVSSTNKTDCHNITEILLKVALNTILNYHIFEMINFLHLNSTWLFYNQQSSLQ